LQYVEGVAEQRKFCMEIYTRSLVLRTQPAPADLNSFIIIRNASETGAPAYIAGSFLSIAAVRPGH
jgi:hypothetical protein